MRSYLINALATVAQWQFLNLFLVKRGHNLLWHFGQISTQELICWKEGLPSSATREPLVGYRITILGNFYFAVLNSSAKIRG